MKLIKINTDRYLVVDETIQPVSGYYYDSFIKAIRNTNGAEYGETKHCWQITHSTNIDWNDVYYIPFQEVKELIGEVDVEKKARICENYNECLSELDQAESAGRYYGFKYGYNQAIEDNKEKKYTEEDLLNALYSMWYKAKDGDFNIKEAVKASIDYVQPKTEWEVEIVDGKLKLK